MTNTLFIVLHHVITQSRDALNPKRISFKAFPYGVLSLATYLKTNDKNSDVNIKIIDCNLYDYDTSIKIIEKELVEFRPDIVGLSMNYDIAYKYLENISKIVKDNNKDTIIILGGSAASFSYEEIIDQQKYIDAICYTEGELPFTRLVSYVKDNKKRLDYLNSGIDKSFITKSSLEKGIIPEKSFVENLDDVIDIDYDILGDQLNQYKMIEAFSPVNDYSENKKQFFLVTSRGCPYRCIFCSTSKGLYNNKIRYASVDKIIDHVRYLKNKYQMNVLTIYDDQLLLNKERAKELFRRLTEFNLRIECPNGLSPAFLDNEMAYLMRNAGLDTIILAIESGSEYMLRKVIHKPVNLKMIKPLVKILRKYDFFVEGFFVIGIPGETDKHREETMNFIRDICFDWCSFNLATPLRGSRLYDMCIKNNYIPSNLKIGDIEDKRYIISTPDYPDPEYINKQTYLMNLDINFVNNYRMKIGDYEIAKRCFEDVINRTTNHAFAYLFLSECQKILGEDPIKIMYNKDRFYDIIEKDNTWKEYAKIFGLI